MWQTESQVSARIKPEDKEAVNNFLAEYQQRVGKVFSSFRDLFLHLCENGIPEAETPETIGEHILLDDIRPECLKYAEDNELLMDSTVLDIVKHSLTNVKTVETPVEVEKMIEVEKPLEPNQILISLDDEFKDTLELINANRNRELKSFNQSETLAETMIESFFNEAHLFNWNDNFYTGLG